jgi:hypothetical protein
MYNRIGEAGGGEFCEELKTTNSTLKALCLENCKDQKLSATTLQEVEPPSKRS